MTAKEMVKLDLIDQKILSVLIKNSRISISELAKIIKHHYPTVRNRLNKLVDNGVINNFYPVLQFPGIGIRRYIGVYLCLRNISTEEQSELIKTLMRNPFLIHVYELEEKWNIFLLLATNYIKEARDTLDWVKQKCGKSLVSFMVMPTYTISPLNRKFFLRSEFEINQEKIKTGYNQTINKTPLIHLEKHIDLDETDIKILDFIRLNARTPIDEIAEYAKIDSSLVNYKFKKYIKSNLIKYFSIDVDPEVLGYSQYLLFLNLQGDTKGKELLIEYLKKTKEAYHYFEYLGYYEIVITLCVKSREEMEDVKNDIIKKFNEYIKDNEVLWVKKRYKFDPYPEVKLVYPKK